MSQFIVFEGIDKSGKSTQLKLLAERIAREGEETCVSREPGGCPISEDIRALVLKQSDMCPQTEALLFAAARAQHVRQVLRPALEEGRHVLLDRYIHSSLAYQVYGRGLAYDTVMALNKPAMDDLWPDRVYLLDISPEEALLRKEASGEATDRMENGGLLWLQKLREGYRELAAMDSRIVLLDASGSREALHEAIWTIWMQNHG